MGACGSNLLNRALRIIGTQSFIYYAFIGRDTNSIGQDIANYAAPVTLQGSVQPPPRQLLEIMGLDFNKSYLMFYVRQDILDVTRDISGDQMFYAGSTYQCLSKTDWSAQDGWVDVMTVRVKKP